MRPRYPWHELPGLLLAATALGVVHWWFGTAFWMSVLNSVALGWFWTDIYAALRGTSR